MLSGEYDSVNLFFVEPYFIIDYVLLKKFNFYEESYKNTDYLLLKNCDGKFVAFYFASSFETIFYKCKEDILTVPKTEKLAVEPLMQLYNQGISDGQAQLVNKLNSL